MHEVDGIGVAPPLGAVGAGGAGRRERERHGDGDDRRGRQESPVQMVRHGGEPIGPRGLDVLETMFFSGLDAPARDQPLSARRELTCDAVYDWTGNEQLAHAADLVIGMPPR